MQILMLLDNEQREMRNSEIARTLWEKQQKRSGEKPAFKVKVTRELQRLNKDNSVRKHLISHKNVAYSITEQGQQILKRFLLKNLISTMPPIEIQVLVQLTHILISKVFIMAPYETTLEEYIKRFKEELNREDIGELAKALTKDPKKLYSKFYEHVKRYRTETMLEAHHNSMNIESQHSS